jgi:hypothetical protein
MPLSTSIGTSQQQQQQRERGSTGEVLGRVDMRGRAEFATTFKALFNKEQFSDITFVFPSSSSSSSSSSAPPPAKYAAPQ